jgi:hypothetical protein
LFNFGAGRARLIPAGGGQPVELGVVQSASVELKVDLKELRGPYRYPIQIADGKGTASGKVNFAQFWPETLAALLGGTQSNGAQHAAVGETHTVGATPFHVTLANATTLVAGSEVVGVIDATGNPVWYTRVTSGSEASSSVAGQANGAYSINTSTGVLTFASADTLLTVIVSYEYTVTSDINSNTVALQQVGMNTATTFQLTLIGVAAKNGFTNQSQQFLVQFNACLAPSIKFDMKLDDWTYQDLDFQAYIDASGNLGSLYLINPGGVAASA